MTIALSGSTIEPVISHSTAKVSTTSRPTASGRLEPIASCWSTNSAAAPPTSSGYGVGRARISLHERLRGVALGRAGHGDVHLPGRVVERPRLGHRAHAGQPLEPRRVLGDAGPLAAGASIAIVDRVRVLAAEVARERVGDGARALALRDHGGVDRGPDRPAAPAARATSISIAGDRRPPAAGGASPRGRAGTSAPCSAGRSGRRRRTASFAPQIANSVGAITSEARPATSATTAPAIPIDCRKPSGKTVSVIRAKDTVTAL